MANECMTCEGVSGYNTIAECISAQQQGKAAFLDPLGTLNGRPYMSPSVVRTYKAGGVMLMLDQIREAFGLSTETVDTVEYYWAQDCKRPLQTFKIAPVAGPAPGAGLPVVTTVVSPGFVPINGRTIYINQLGQQKARITGVVKLGSGIYQITLQPISGQVLDLTKLSCYDAFQSPMREVDFCNDDCVVPEGLTANYPSLMKGYMQKYDKAICLKMCELDGTGSLMQPRVWDKTDRFGNTVKYWTSDKINMHLTNAYLEHRAFEILFNRRDDTTQTGFDGIIPTFEDKGVTVEYDPSNATSLKSYFFNMMKSLKASGVESKEFMLWYDRQFGYSWGEALNTLLSNQNNLNAPATLKRVGNTLTWDYMTNLKIGNDLSIMGKEMDIFSSYEYGTPKHDYAILFPVNTYWNDKGDAVAPIQLVNVKGATNIMNGKIELDTKDLIQCEKLTWVMRDAFGLKVHCACQAGIFVGKNC